MKSLELFDISKIECSCYDCKHRIINRCHNSYWSICDVRFVGKKHKRVKAHQEGCSKYEKKGLNK